MSQFVESRKSTCSCACVLLNFRFCVSLTGPNGLGNTSVAVSSASGHRSGHEGARSRRVVNQFVQKLWTQVNAIIPYNYRKKKSYGRKNALGGIRILQRRSTWSILCTPSLGILHRWSTSTMEHTYSGAVLDGEYFRLYLKM